ncbi:MAG: hypothetical protein MUC50_20210 [Myxococcota bacterium]|nr:hypothetical protein [Myxococcota bacterium]
MNLTRPTFAPATPCREPCVALALAALLACMAPLPTAGPLTPYFAAVSSASLPFSAPALTQEHGGSRLASNETRTAWYFGPALWTYDTELDHDRGSISWLSLCHPRGGPQPPRAPDEPARAPPARSAK